MRRLRLQLRLGRRCSHGLQAAVQPQRRSWGPDGRSPGRDGLGQLGLGLVGGAALLCMQRRDGARPGQAPAKFLACEEGSSERLPSLARTLPCGLPVLDQIAWWDVGGEVPYTGKLRALLEAGGASFYDDDHRNFLKSPMVSLVAIGGVPVRPTSTDTLEMLYGDVVVPVPLESIRKALRNQMGMTAMFSYLNRRAVPAEEMWEVVANLGHFSVGHAAHLSFVLVGHSCAVENEINSQRDVVHLGRLTVARTRAQKDPPLVVQLPELLPAYKELRQKVEECVLSEVDKRPKSSSISIQDWQEALYLGWPSAKAHVAVLTGSLRNLQKLVGSIDDEGKEAEYRALLWQIAVACNILLPDMFPDPNKKFKWRPPDHMMPKHLQDRLRST